MIGQTRCPNCGGYKVTSEVVEAYISGHSQAYEFAEWVPVGWLFWISVIAIALGLLVGFNDGHGTGGAICGPFEQCPGNPYQPSGLYYLLIDGAVILLLIWALLLFVILPLIRSDDEHRPTRAVGNSYSCQLCGYRWTVRDGEPQPKGPTGGVNKRLIELGEDYQRRQNDAIAGALYQQEQERKRQQNR